MNAEVRRDVLNVVLSHQSAPAIERMLKWWKEHVPIDSILIAYGGDRNEFDSVNHSLKIYIDDPRLRTRDYQRELQSYTKLYRAVGEFLKAKGSQFNFVHFAESDHLPIAKDLNQRQVEQLEKERADVIGFHLHRVDGTSNAHFLYHASNKEFGEYWAATSRRAEPEVILSMFGSGSFWTREAFLGVAFAEEPFPIYMEIYLPTLAHHLGFRVRDYAEQDKFVGVLRDKTNEIKKAQNAGAWTLHPVKYLWDR